MKTYEKYFFIIIGIAIFLGIIVLSQNISSSTRAIPPTPFPTIEIPTNTPVPTDTPTPITRPVHQQTSSDWQYKAAMTIAMQNCLNIGMQAVNKMVAQMNAVGTPLSGEQIKQAGQTAINNCYQAAGLTPPTN